MNMHVRPDDLRKSVVDSLAAPSEDIARHVLAMAGASPDQIEKSITTGSGLWGDSHGAQYATALHAALDPQGQGWRQMTKSGCPPIPTPILYPQDRLHRLCPAFDREALADVLTAPSGSLIILAARWDAIMSRQLEFANSAGRPSIANAQADLRRVLQALTARGYEVAVLGQVPIPPQDVESCLSRAKFDRQNLAACAEFGPAETVRAAGTDAATWNFVTGAAAGLDHVVLVRPWADLCSDGACHMVGPDGAAYLDATHLSKAGALRVLRHLQGAITAAHAPTTPLQRLGIGRPTAW
jgi:hypothetical protein